MGGRGVAGGEDGGGQRVLLEAFLLRAGALVAARRLRRLPAGCGPLPGAFPRFPPLPPASPACSFRRRYLSAGRALRPGRGQRQPGAPGAGGAGGAAAA